MDTFTSMVDDMAEAGDAFVKTRRPGRFHWQRDGKKRGFFYLKNSELMQTSPDEVGGPWKVSDRFPGEEAFECTALRIVPIALRMQPFEWSETKPKTRMYGAFVAGRRMQFDTELLCLPEGMSEVVTWRCDGMIGKALTSQGGILSTYREGLYAAGLRKAQAAKRAAGQDASTASLPLYSFWLPIDTLATDRGVPILKPTAEAGNDVTIPALTWKEGQPFTDEDVNTYFVGRDIFLWAKQVRLDFADWLQKGGGDQLSGKRSEGAE